MKGEGHALEAASFSGRERWFEENDPEGVAFEYEVLERNRIGRRIIMRIAALAVIWNLLGQ
jgi:hypothetical protein